ncbi:TetR/AcrR family transcriptional regulator [Sciscionella marina]|uniref:TetR/AcrR family transcriptional regulator n=1 Tax=Sciscionella marina TaxID=508770 RepID=UPI00035E696F|nr:TetR/AcrR family transcriptional regulator [Sciscionella marina]
MGNREDLMTGALQCLREKGYARTTARDITSVAGTSLAAIGYHFGSTQNLLNEAAKSLAEQWFAARTRAREATTGIEDPAERLLAFFREVVETFTSDRPMTKAIVDMMLQVDHVKEIREVALATFRPAIIDYLVAFEGVSPESVDEHTIRTAGNVYLAVFHGLMLHYVLDPESAPKPEDFVAGMRAIAARLAPANMERA